MTELIRSGFELMIVGMGIVYVFLTLLVVAINMMSAVVQRFFPAPPKAQKGVKMEADNATAAAIAAAVHQYREKHK